MLRRGIYAIVDLDHLPPGLAGGAVELAALALAGGAVALQLRAKRRTTAERVAIGREINALCVAADVPLFINDDPQAAAECRAAGLHLGQEDLHAWPIERVRALLGPATLLGISTHDMEQARLAAAQGADYVAFGPVFSAATKGSADAPRGLALLAEICQAVKRPIVAIGGIGPDNVAQVAAAGAHMAAVITAISCANDPRQATAELTKRFIESV